MTKDEVVQEKSQPLPEIERKIVVDLWRTKLHGVTTGFRQLEEHRAKSRQFSKDMKLFGEVKEKKKGEEETIGYLGYRESLWHEQENKLDRRLVIKLFSKSIYYQGTLEEMIAREFTRSLSARKDFPAFNIMIDGFEYLIALNKVRGGWFVPEWFVFRIDGEEEFIPIILKHKIGPGIDYRVVSGIGNTQFGLINGKKFDVGGRYEISLKTSDKRLLNSVLVRSLILFASSLRFHKDIFHKLKKGKKLLKKGEWSPSISNEELLLRRNPRAILRK